MYIPVESTARAAVADIRPAPRTACSFPLIVKKFPQLRVPHHFL